MLQSFSLSLSRHTEEEYGGWDGLRADCALLGCDGVEGIWGGEDVPADFPTDLLTGYHLTFFPDWLDFWRGDRAALTRKYGSVEAARDFYGLRDGEDLERLYREDLARARTLGANYVVFHVSDVSMEEGYTYRWLHTDEEVIDASAQIINRLLDGISADFDFLVENQWWPGFTFTGPAGTARLLDGIRYPRKGIMLDTGHLMNTNTAIRTQAEGLSHIRRMLAEHGELTGWIRGLHLHQSISGAYVRRHTGFLPPDLPRDNVERFCAGYEHIQRIDRHRPWTDPEIARLVDELAPRYLTHELAAADRAERRRAVGRQAGTLKAGRGSGKKNRRELP